MTFGFKALIHSLAVLVKITCNSRDKIVVGTIKYWNLLSVDHVNGQNLYEIPVRKLGSRIKEELSKVGSRT